MADQRQFPSVRAFLFDADGSDQEVHPKDLRRQAVADRQLLWIDVDLRDPQALADIGSALPIQQESLDRMQESPSGPHLQNFGEYFHLNVRSLGASSDADKPEADKPKEIDCVVGRNWMLTAHREGIELIDSFLAPIKGETELGRVEGPVFLAILLDWFLSGYFRAIEEVETRLDKFDESLIARDLPEGSEAGLLRHLVEHRHDIMVLRRTLSAHREIFATLSQPEFVKVSKSESAERYRVLTERLDKAIAAAENAREMAMGSLNIVMTRTAQRTNDVMKILTVISAVLLPALVTAGILGMNFPLSFFERTELSWVVVLAMVALGISIVAFARHRRWF